LNDEFYIGYLPKAPSGTAGFVRRVIVGLAILGVIMAVALVFSQMPFAKSYFEYGNLRDFEGTIQREPYPSLLVARPGQAKAGESASEYLLVAPGKHGAGELLAGLAGKSVKLRGQLIYRDGETMVEVEPGSVKVLNAAPLDEAASRDMGPLTVTGEIVDSKCYFGVMNPGQGKVHRDCASRCLSGGIPPLLIDSVNGKRYLLVGQRENALPYWSFKEFIAEPLTLTGELVQRGDQQLLMIDPMKLRRNAPRM
jgi:hypothetical protein